jgi:XTP/dITP diphosphohydrolase
VTLYCATTNPGKLREFQMAAAVQVLPGLDLIVPPDETGVTFEENAILKARYYSKHADGYLFVDDSGLEVDALGGAPGVFSARYAGEAAGDEANLAKLLSDLEGVVDRRARFVCVVALAVRGELVQTFRGTVEGLIVDGPRGGNGFGYDPVFYYEPFGCTFGETESARKQEVSHRGSALRQMADWVALSNIMRQWREG